LANLAFSSSEVGSALYLMESPFSKSPVTRYLAAGAGMNIGF